MRTHAAAIPADWTHTLLKSARLFRDNYYQRDHSAHSVTHSGQAVQVDHHLCVLWKHGGAYLNGGVGVRGRRVDARQGRVPCGSRLIAHLKACPIRNPNWEALSSYIRGLVRHSIASFRSIGIQAHLSSLAGYGRVAVHVS